MVRQRAASAEKRDRKLLTWAGLVVVVLAIVTGLVTFAILTGLTPVKPNRTVNLWLMAINLALVLTMATMIAWQVVSLIRARRRGIAGAGLHIRLVSLFSLIAGLPALLVAAFAAVTLNRGLDVWFSERTRSIVDSAVTVAEAYIRDHGETARGDVAAIAADINQQKQLYDENRPEFVKRVARNAAWRGLIGAFVFDLSQRRIDANVTINDKVAFRAPPDEAIKKADDGELVVIPPSPTGNVVRALVKLSNFPSHYLYVYRVVNPSVMEQLTNARVGKAEYDQAMASRADVQVTFGLMYAGVSFIFLMSAIWLGLWLADRLVAPIIRVLDASRKVSDGDLAAKVDVVEGPGDLATLGRSFNRMTAQLKTQRDALVNTNHELDERRRFSEAMLAGVSAGIIGLDPKGHISLVNRSALQLLSRSQSSLIGKPLGEALPEFQPILDLALSRTGRLAEGQVSARAGGKEHNFLVRVTTELTEEAEHGHVLTFDDITDLVAAQRNSAWADIARRIAHEIKNPLTPIQLSAERLKRKYGKEIQSDRQVFDQCTDTIIRQVGDIGRMVDEFSSFARMPSAVLEPQDLASVVKEATVLQRVSASDLQIDVHVPSEPLIFAFDRRLITQAVTNLVKNAREAIESRHLTKPEPSGHILVEAGTENNAPFVSVTDNGIGLPKEKRNRLTEPYVTTREKGTGLGLAIVKRVMEEHHGRLVLEDAPQDFADGLGARVRLEFEPVTVAGTAIVKDEVNA